MTVTECIANGAPGRTTLHEGEGRLSIQLIRVKPGHEAEFVSRFTELDVLGQAAEATAGTMLEASLVQHGSDFAVVTAWASDRGLDGWVSSPSRERVRAALEELYVEPPTVTSYALRATLAGTAPGGRFGE